MVRARAAARLRAGHVWVYRSDLVSPSGLSPGALVTVCDPRGKTLGTALYSSASQIALRMISGGPVADGGAFHELLRQRLRVAAEYRRWAVNGSDAYRVVFSEADALPGLIVDRYNDVLALQALTQAMDSPEVKATVVAALLEEFSPAGVVERVDARIRKLEHLPESQGGLLAGEKDSTVFTMNGVRFHYRAGEGQKTGAFLDQRENYAAAAGFAHGHALDVFCYQGGFALHLARVCENVAGVDSSRPALEMAEQNEALNRAASSAPEIEWIEGNAFDLLKDYAAAGRQYDTIVLDPPAFAKSKTTVETALRGYKELNLRALKMLQPGGILVTCSCSYHLSEADYMGVVAAAAADAHRTLRVLEKRVQAKDHPVLLSVPETSYLKCLILTVSNLK
ncbi:MAG: class I SAM-dependent rRNA methyltransferase [Terriglobales bacterium]